MEVNSLSLVEVKEDNTCGRFQFYRPVHSTELPARSA